jgi:hypothetical protein
VTLVSFKFVAHKFATVRSTQNSKSAKNASGNCIFRKRPFCKELTQRRTPVRHFSDIRKQSKPSDKNSDVQQIPRQVLNTSPCPYSGVLADWLMCTSHLHNGRGSCLSTMVWTHGQVELNESEWSGAVCVTYRRGSWVGSEPIRTRLWRENACSCRDMTPQCPDHRQWRLNYDAHLITSFCNIQFNIMIPSTAVSPMLSAPTEVSKRKFCVRSLHPTHPQTYTISVNFSQDPTHSSPLIYWNAISTCLQFCRNITTVQYSVHPWCHAGQYNTQYAPGATQSGTMFSTPLVPHRTVQCQRDLSPATVTAQETQITVTTCAPRTGPRLPAQHASTRTCRVITASRVQLSRRKRNTGPYCPSGTIGTEPGAYDMFRPTKEWKEEQIKINK